MELKPGYKQTDVGVIPEVWEVKDLGSLCPFVTSGSRGWAKFYSDRGSPFIRITNLSRESIYLNLADLKYVNLPPRAKEGIRTQLEEHDVLISITADIGIVGYVTSHVPLPAYINQHIALVRFDPKRTDGRFVSYFLSSENPQKLFRASTDLGAKAGMSLLTVQKLRAAFPPLAEQHAIAGVLGDVDALIESQEKLIAKKRGLKQAAMRQLLTGQTRLPGFNSEREVKRLGEVANVIKGRGLSKSQVTESGTRPCVLYGELFTIYGRVISEVVSRTMSDAGLPSQFGDVLVPASTTTTGIDLATASALLQDGVALGGDINVIRQKVPSFDPVFLANYLTNVMQSAIAELAQGITIIHLYGRDLATLLLCVPSVTEQSAIAAVLSNMDAELEALDQRLSKTRAIKLGVMQELLTGRTRLA